MPHWEVPLPVWWPPHLRGTLSIIEYRRPGRISHAALPAGLEPYGANMVVHVPTLRAIGGFGRPKRTGRQGAAVGRGRAACVAPASGWPLGSLRLADRRAPPDPGGAPDPGAGCCRGSTGKAFQPCCTRRLLGQSAAVWRELPRRFAVAACWRRFGLLPRRSTLPGRLPLAARLCGGLHARGTWPQPCARRVARVKLYRWRGAQRNFGDELNALLWPRLLPGFFDDDAAALFLGIGSVLDARHETGAVKLVAGAGYGGYEPPPTLDANWIVHWVRGPLTARRLGLPEVCGLGDPAMLLSATCAGGRCDRLHAALREPRTRRLGRGRQRGRHHPDRSARRSGRRFIAAIGALPPAGQRGDAWRHRGRRDARALDRAAAADVACTARSGRTGQTHWAFGSRSGLWQPPRWRNGCTLRRSLATRPRRRLLHSSAPR